MSVSTVNQYLLDTAIAPPAEIESVREQERSASNLAAFESILAHDLDRLYRIAFRLLRNHEDAEDALQEGLWKAFRRLPSFEGRSTLSTWITRIVINSALMTLRRRKSHLEFSLDEMTEGQSEPLASSVADKRPNPEQMCAVSELIKTTETQFLRLSGWEQSAIRHVVMNGHSMKESASIVGVPVATFKSRVFRTRRKLAHGIHHSSHQACGAFLTGNVIHDPKLQ